MTKAYEKGGNIMRQVFRYVSYRVRVAVVMALFAVVPLSLFGMFYFNNANDQATHPIF